MGVLKKIAAVLWRLWRLIGTAISFIVFGLGGLFVGLVVGPALYLIPGSKRRAAIARRVIGALFSTFVEVMRFLGVLRYRIRMEAPLPSPPFLVVANHPSLIDVIFLIKLFPTADCVVKRAHWSNPFMMSAVRAANYVPNSNTADVLAQCAERLRKGTVMTIFPEGTRTVPGEEPRYHRGPALLALETGASLLPVRIKVEPTTLTKSEPWYHIPERQVLVELTVLPHIEPKKTASIRTDSINLNAQLKSLLSE